MVKIIRLETIESIKAGTGSRILPDGTILNPESYQAVNVFLDNGEKYQIERPLTLVKLQQARAASRPPITIDGLTTGQVV